MLIDSCCYGLFNCVNTAENVSRFDYVEKIVELFNLDCTVEKADKGMFKRVAPVSKNESAINYKLNLMNLNVMRNWDLALNEFVQILKKDIL